jgi:putative ABC transport system permease protein
MIKNYLKLAFKSIISQGHQSVISAISLSVALSCSILILLYVQYELSYDNYHKKADQIYRIVAKNPGSKYLGKSGFAVTSGPLKEVLANEVPGIKYSTKCMLRTHILDNKSSLVEEKGILYTDPDFLRIFTFPVISWDPVEALKEPFTLLLTKKMAIKYFGNEDPIGKTIKADNSYIFTVSGVLEDIPVNSHFNFDFITGIKTYYSIRGGKERVERWGSNIFITYISLMDNVKPEDIKDNLEKLNLKYVNKENHPGRSLLVPEPLKGIHLSGNANFELGNNNDIRYLYLITSIGIFILLIACFNYMNMATARSYSRGREIGILKVTGSSKNNIIVQFLIESVLLSAGALILALIIVWFLIPVFSAFADSPMNYGMIFEHFALIKIIALMLFAGLFAGIYPAIHLSSISPLHLIKEDFKNIGGKRRSVNLRNLIVVLQYTISIVALISTMTVLRQLSFIKASDPGFVKDNILNVFLRDPVIRANPEVLISTLRENPQIVDIATSVNLPTTIIANASADWDGKSPGENLNIFRCGIGDNFIDFYNLEIIAGRGFSKDFSADSVNSLIINQKTASDLGWYDPIGKRLAFGNNTEHVKVIGVVKDFYFHSLHLDIEPLSFSPVGGVSFPSARYISIKFNPGTILETRQFVEKTLKDLSPGFLNPVTVFSDTVDDMYKTEKKTADIFIISTVLAVILTCLGQYSLSAYTTRSRSREMVIRKVMGSQPSGILALLTSEMAKWILVSLFFAWPIAYFLMTKWLQGFAYHIKIGAGVFIYSLLISILISLIAISYHVIKLSRVNPAELIRHN